MAPGAAPWGLARFESLWTVINFPPNDDHPDPPEYGDIWPPEGDDQWIYTEPGYWKRIPVGSAIVEAAEQAAIAAQEAAEEAAEKVSVAVLGQQLTGLTTEFADTITDADTVLSAFGKLQAQVTDHAEDDANPSEPNRVDPHVWASYDY